MDTDNLELAISVLNDNLCGSVLVVAALVGVIVGFFVCRELLKIWLP